MLRSDYGGDPLCPLVTGAAGTTEVVPVQAEGPCWVVLEGTDDGALYLRPRWVRDLLDDRRPGTVRQLCAAPVAAFAVEIDELLAHHLVAAEANRQQVIVSVDLTAVSGEERAVITALLDDHRQAWASPGITLKITLTKNPARDLPVHLKYGAMINDRPSEEER